MGSVGGDHSHASGDEDDVQMLPDGPGFGLDRPGGGGNEGGGDNILETSPQSFVALGRRKALGPLNWSLVSRVTRAGWEKSMSSCCLGLVLQQRRGDLGAGAGGAEEWGSENFFTLLTDHAVRGLMLLGAPHPNEILIGDEVATAAAGRSGGRGGGGRKRGGGGGFMRRLMCCVSPSGGDDGDDQDEALTVPGGMEMGLTLSDAEVNTVSS